MHLEKDVKKVRLVAQLVDEHNVGHLDEKMKRLDYLEKVLASNRYVFSDIPKHRENMKMVKMMKKYVNKDRYNLYVGVVNILSMVKIGRSITDGQPYEQVQMYSCLHR